MVLMGSQRLYLSMRYDSLYMSDKKSGFELSKQSSIRDQMLNLVSHTNDEMNWSDLYSNYVVACPCV